LPSGYKSIKILNDAQIRYSRDNSHVLLDGIRATSWYNDGYWAGFEGQDFEAMIDLGSEMTIGSVQVGFLEDQNAWIFLPDKVEVLVSSNGNKYEQMETGIKNEIIPYAQKRIKDFGHLFEPRKVQFIKIKAHNIKICPDWHAGAGGKAWLFIDEIIIN